MAVPITFSTSGTFTTVGLVGDPLELDGLTFSASWQFDSDNAPSRVGYYSNGDFQVASYDSNFNVAINSSAHTINDDPAGSVSFQNEYKIMPMPGEDPFYQMVFLFGDFSFVYDGNEYLATLSSGTTYDHLIDDEGQIVLDQIMANTGEKGYGLPHEQPIALTVWDSQGNRMGFFEEAYDMTVGLAAAADPDPTPTPEPATIILLGSGLMGLVGLKRKKDKA